MAKAKRTPKRKPRKAPTPRGQIGPQTYAQVRKIVDEKKIPMTEAFAEVAKATGRSPGTVAVTYYRIARREDGQTRGRRRGKPGRPLGSSRVANSGGRVQAVLSRASGVIKELEEVIAHQAQEIDRLRKESRFAERIRRALHD